jgi:hypothetical protein
MDGTNLQREPFTRYHEEKKVDSFSVRLNENERQTLESAKSILEQTKDSTALKQLALIGAKVIQEEKTRYLLASIYSNKRKNERLGIVDFT